MTSVAVTGHRPNKLGLPQKADLNQPLLNLCESTLMWLGPQRVICGMALGFDLHMAAAARRLRIPLVAAIPCDRHLNNPVYWELRGYAKRTGGVHIITPGPYAPWKMQRRNEWMVDQVIAEGGDLVALWDGSSSGTANCLKYASQNHWQYANLWPDWAKIQ